MSTPTVRTGFIVGVGEEGIIFNLIGTSPNLVELLGLLRIAEEKVSEIFTKSTQTELSPNE